MKLWSELGDPSNSKFSMEVSHDIISQAMCCLAAGYFEKSIVGSALHISPLRQAANFADVSAAFGFVPPIVLKIPATIRDHVLDNPRFAGKFDPSIFEEFSHMWEALAVRQREFQEEEAQREAKVSKKPLAYRCAAEGCGVGATKKATLQRCGGKCLLEMKPSYCSKECQKADWKRHRPFCKPDVTPSVGHDVQTAVAPYHTGPEPPEADIKGSISGDGQERSIEIFNPTIPGGKIVLSSKTMTPSYLRSLKADLEKRRPKA